MVAWPWTNSLSCEFPPCTCGYKWISGLFLGELRNIYCNGQFREKPSIRLIFGCGRKLMALTMAAEIIFQYEDLQEALVREF